MSAVKTTLKAEDVFTRSQEASVRDMVDVGILNTLNGLTSFFHRPNLLQSYTAQIPGGWYAWAQNVFHDMYYQLKTKPETAALNKTGFFCSPTAEMLQLH